MLWYVELWLFFDISLHIFPGCQEFIQGPSRRSKYTKINYFRQKNQQLSFFHFFSFYRVHALIWIGNLIPYSDQCINICGDIDFNDILTLFFQKSPILPLYRALLTLSKGPSIALTWNPCRSWFAWHWDRTHRCCSG